LDVESLLFFNLLLGLVIQNRPNHFEFALFCGVLSIYHVHWWGARKCSPCELDVININISSKSKGVGGELIGTWRTLLNMNFHIFGPCLNLSICEISLIGWHHYMGVYILVQ
jgi:hypothetical protein